MAPYLLFYQSTQVCHSPQGSILASYYFLFTLTTFLCILNVLKCFLFVDDTKVFKKINQQEDAIHLQLDLNSLSLWSHDIDLIFNAIKSTCLSFKCKSHTEYQLDGSEIPLKQLQKTLVSLYLQTLLGPPTFPTLLHKLTKFWIYFDVPLAIRITLWLRRNYI